MKKTSPLIPVLMMTLVLGCTAMAELPETPDISINNRMLKSLTDTGRIQQDGRTTSCSHMKTGC